MTPIKMAGKVGIKFDFGSDYSIEDKSIQEQLHQLKRKVRYLAYAMKARAIDGNANVEVPSKFIEHFEGLEHFEGWAGFANVWDVKKSSPLEVYYRDFSVEEEWEATIRRVVPELAVDRIHRQRTE